MSSRTIVLAPMPPPSLTCARWTLDGSGIGLTEDTPSVASLTESTRSFSNVIWNADGSGLRSPGVGLGEELYDGRLSPDGRFEVVSVGDRVWVRSVDGLSLSILGFGFSPSFLP